MERISSLLSTVDRKIFARGNLRVLNFRMFYFCRLSKVARIFYGVLLELRAHAHMKFKTVNCYKLLLHVVLPEKSLLYGILFKTLL